MTSDALPVHSPGSQAPLRVGLIGVTGYALAYFEELNKLRQDGLVQWGAVTIINRRDAPEQVAFFESAGIPVYDDYRSMLEAEKDRLDWVCIPTAIGWHTRMTVDVLRRGLPVLLEKPIAPTLQDVEAIQAAERVSGKVVAIGYQHHYSASTWEIKERLISGHIGQITHIDSICLWPRGRGYYQRNNWSGRLYDGYSWVLDSPLHNAISHVVNLILFFSGSTLEGRADPVSVEAELYRSKAIESYDTIRCQVEMDTRIRAGVVFSHSSVSTIDPEIRITGTQGTLTWRFCGSHTFTRGDEVEILEREDLIRIREHMFRKVVRHLQGDKTSRICSTEQAKGEVKWVNAVQDATAIHDIPEDFRETRPNKQGDLVDVVKGLDSAAVKAYEEGCWFSDLGLPWAVAPGQLDLRGYSSFQARKIPNPGPLVVTPLI